MTANSTGVHQRPRLAADDTRAMLPVKEVAALLGVSVPLLKRQHLADPDAYPAERVGILWHIPRWWVDRKVACGLPPEGGEVA